MSRLIALVYGMACYAFFFVTFLYAIAFVEDFPVPRTIDAGLRAPMTEALLINMLLMALFAIQHSVMARPQFKAWWTQFVPKPVERSTYVLFASALLALLCWQWRPIPAVVWHVSDPLAAAMLTGLSVLGFLIVLSSSFLINHFELFVVHHVLNNFFFNDTATTEIYTPLFYNFVRHPLYLGFIIAFWVAPTMTAGHLLFAAVTTAYIFIGMLLEERDLVDLFGDDYRRYRQRVAMIVPWRRAS